MALFQTLRAKLGPIGALLSSKLKALYFSVGFVGQIPIYKPVYAVAKALLLCGPFGCFHGALICFGRPPAILFDPASDFLAIPYARTNAFTVKHDFCHWCFAYKTPAARLAF